MVRTNALLPMILAMAPLLGAPAPALAKTLKVVATTTDLAELARRVGGDKVSVESLASPVANPHFVDAKPSFMVKLMKADLFLQTGLELESGWAPLLVQGSRNRAIQAGTPGFLDASTAIIPMNVPVNPTRAMGDVHPGGNPHYMADPENAVLVAKLIAKRLGELAPEDAAAFERNAGGFEEALRKRLAGWLKVLEPYRGAKYVGYHQDWTYFAGRFGFVAAGEIEPKPGIPPTAAHTARLIETMKNDGVRLIFNDPWYESRTPEAIARSTGATVLKMALFPGGTPETKDYLSQMDYNVRIVAEALSKP